MARNAHTQTIGTSLAAYFIGLGMTQAQVAARYHVSQSWVGRIYRGEFSARAKTVSRMCEAAGIPFLHNQEKDQDGEITKNRLLRLLATVWEGTEEDASHLTAALLAIKQLRAPTNRVHK